jgi:hypothetical protein
MSDSDQFTTKTWEFLSEFDIHQTVTIDGTVFHHLPKVDPFVATEFPELPDVPGVPPPPCTCWECTDEPPIAEVGDYIY